jgi:hypothetical protein
MLVGFTVKNFRSFLSEQTCSYSATPDRAHESTHCIHTGLKAIPRLSKVGVVFGPNAGGKTNLVTALATLRELVVHSSAFSEYEFAEHYTPFQFGSSQEQPTEFTIDIVLHKMRYRYSVSYDSERVTSEQLRVYRTGKPQRWFHRRFDANSQTERWAPFSPNFNGPREMWRRATRPRVLFLTTAAQLHSEQLEPLLHWFEHELAIVFPTLNVDMHHAAEQLQDTRLKARLLSLLNAADIRIEDVRVAESGSRSPSARPVGDKHDIECLHAFDGCTPVWLDSTFESAGVRRLVWLSGLLFEAIEHGKLLVIDEFDVSLHPLVARIFIHLVTDPVVADTGAQLLLTSHNTTLMDVNLLRRDQIWLIELDSVQSSALAPVSQMGPRKRDLIGKAYLSGRYGAIPLIRLPPKSASHKKRGAEA